MRWLLLLALLGAACGVQLVELPLPDATTAPADADAGAVDAAVPPDAATGID